MGVVEPGLGKGQILGEAVVVEGLRREAHGRRVAERDVHLRALAEQGVVAGAHVARGVVMA